MGVKCFEPKLQVDSDVFGGSCYESYYEIFRKTQSSGPTG